VCYFVPLAGREKTYCTPDSFFCCSGTGVENHAKYGDSIYFHQAQKILFVNLFIASELHWREAGVNLRQETKYPNEGRTRLIFTGENPIELQIQIRHPSWATSGFTIQVNGVRQNDDSQPGSYAVVARQWKSSDTLEVEMPFSLRTEGFHDNPHRVALLYGPLVLCAATGNASINGVPYPAMVVEDGRLSTSLEPVPGKPCTFRGSSELLRFTETPNHAAVTLEPFYSMPGFRKYVVYWNLFSPPEWQTNKEQRQALQSRTIDQVRVGEKQDEDNHRMQGEKTANEGGRVAKEGGWFSWEMKVIPDQSQELHIKYCYTWSAGPFDILVDNEKLATVQLTSERNLSHTTIYRLPDKVTQAKEKVIIKFQATPRSSTANIVDCRIVKIEN
jgi:hypothetical protein